METDDSNWQPQHFYVHPVAHLETCPDMSSFEKGGAEFPPRANTTIHVSPLNAVGATVACQTLGF